MVDRRSLITGLISFVAAPAIVRFTSLMPINTKLVPIIGLPIIETPYEVFMSDLLRKIVDTYGLKYDAIFDPFRRC